MKSTKSVAFLIATIVIIAVAGYYWFTQANKTKVKEQFSIIGKWKLDSVFALKPVHDTTSLALVNFSLLSQKDKNPITYLFRPDSTFLYLSNKDSSTNNYTISDSTISIGNSKATEIYSVSFKNDGSVLLIDKDSIATLLKRFE